MSAKRSGLLGQIEDGVLSGVALSFLLQKCIMLGGRAGSEKMRDWARHELNGYRDYVDIPEYRHVRGQVKLTISHLHNSQPVIRSLISADLPKEITRILAEQSIELEDVPLGASIAELEALANSEDAEIKLAPHWSVGLLQILNHQYFNAQSSQATAIYWSVSRASLHGVAAKVRTALSELVAELDNLTPDNQEVPSKDAVDAVTVYLITGDRHVFNNVKQHAAEGGTNVVATTEGGTPVIVSGGHGTAIGSQNAIGSNSTVVGSQKASGNSKLVGRDASGVPSAQEGWWARLRKRGLLVALFTIVGGLTGVVAAIVAVFAWIGWTPW